MIPHLTVAEGADAETEARIEADVRAALPVRARLAEAVLVVFDGTRWAPRLRLPFRA